LKPDWDLSQCVDLRRERLPVVEVAESVALDYLRKRDISVEGMSEGMNLVVSEGYALGFVKRVGARCNNLYPNSLKIVNM
jgi:NOL1/NOP2/fmu family ribosome biogenesis protein